MRPDQVHRTEGLWLQLAAMPVLFTALLLGGGRGGLGDWLAQLLALALLAGMLWSHRQGALRWPAPGWVAALPLLLMLPPLLQLLPLPTAWGSMGGARAELAGQLAVAGVPALGRWSLNPLATEQALWSLLPPAALFLATVSLPFERQRGLLAMLLAMAVLNVFLGMAQLSDGQDSALRLYRPTNAEHAVGLFANRNHFAGFLAMLLPMAVVGTYRALIRSPADGGRDWFGALAGATSLGLLLLGIALSRSRAGLALAILGLLLLAPGLWSVAVRPGTRRMLAVALGLALLLPLNFAVFGALERLKTRSIDEGRLQYAATTLEAARAYAPLGSGFGTFRYAYQPFEAARGEPGRDVINHAHNDYLELWLESGWLVLPLMVLALFGWLLAGRALFFRGVAAQRGSLAQWVTARAAWVAVTLVMLHEAFDYLLRTTAAASGFAVLVGVMVSGIFAPAAPAPTSPAGLPGRRSG